MMKIKKLALKNDIRVLRVMMIFFVLSRMMPHLPSMTPLVNVAIFSSAKVSLRCACYFLCFAFFVSDVLLNVLNHTPWFGVWMYFRYSGVLMILWVGYYLRPQTFFKTLILVLSCTFGFWVWTNLGVWLCTLMYPFTFQGLLNCYGAALPFLRNAWIGNVLWHVILFYLPFMFRAQPRVTSPLVKEIVTYPSRVRGV